MRNRRMDDRVVTAVRVLSIDAIEKAKSGHPGLPLGAAPMAYELWAHHMKHNPANPNWLNRDRFVLSAGHGSMLLYSLLHLFGYGLTTEDLTSFRQWDSLTPGHPEYGHTVGVETTTGPLGQGFAAACGMAMAEAHLAARFNTPEHKVIDHRTYVLCGDGDLMEGVASEAASLAGTLKLGKLIVLYDDNKITIEGSTDLAFKEDVRARFEAYGWHVLEVPDGNDRDAISRALTEAKTREDRPSLIRVRTKIGYGSPKEGSASSHGSPLGEENVVKTKETLGWPTELAPFEVPDEIREYLEQVKERLATEETSWNELYDCWAETDSDRAELLDRALNRRDLTLDLHELLTVLDRDEATRASSGKVLNYVSRKTPFLFGGSADLAPSNNTSIKDAQSFSADNPAGQTIHFGVREFAMAAMANGIALHGALRPYVATFLVFSDYLKGALRLSALMKQPVIYILTHDSIGVGEDGPTHQPIEHLLMLRSIPGLKVYRPAGRFETAAAWYMALLNEEPSALILSRQSIASKETSAHDALRGAYVVRTGGGNPDVLLMASGSELPVTLSAADVLEGEGIKVRVVSVLSMEVFEEQEAAYKESVMPSALRRRIAVEAATPLSWHRYTGLDGKVIGIDGFGASAPGDVLFEKYGFTAASIAACARELLDAVD
ncbi:MAG: transketolase [Saccharofermentanales bacterium]|jgi:transketolase